MSKVANKNQSSKPGVPKHPLGDPPYHLKVVYEDGSDESFMNIHSAQMDEQQNLHVVRIQDAVVVIRGDEMTPDKKWVRWALERPSIVGPE